MIEIKRNGETIQRSRNLRGVISRASKVGVRFVVVQRLNYSPSDPDYHAAEVMISYRDGSRCRTKFESFSVALDFFRKREKRWDLAETKNSDNHYSWSI